MICSAVLRKEWQPGNVGERIAINADIQIDKAIAIRDAVKKGISRFVSAASSMNFV